MDNKFRQNHLAIIEFNTYVKKILFLYSHKTQLNIKLSLLQHYNIMFRPKLAAIFRLYMKQKWKVKSEKWQCKCVVTTPPEDLITTRSVTQREKVFVSKEYNHGSTHINKPKA